MMITRAGLGRTDAIGRRILKIVAGDPDITYAYCYTGWQVVEVREDADTDPYEQYVRGNSVDTHNRPRVKGILPRGSFPWCPSLPAY